jgi:uncharacterized protein YjbI with pentapeptide repeats
MQGIDMMESSLNKAILAGTNFTGANLYCVDFLKATVSDTNFSGANLDRSILQDWRPT